MDDEMMKMEEEAVVWLAELDERPRYLVEGIIGAYRREQGHSGCPRAFLES